MTSSKPEALLLGATGWHGKELSEAFAGLGWRTRRLAFTKLGFATGGRTGLRLGFRRPLPAAVIVRSIPAGSFEQVTLRLSILHALAELGVQVVNDAGAIERCVDKGMTTFLLRRANLPVPETWTTEHAAEARAIVARESLRGRAIVLKPLFGSQGRGLSLLRSPADLPPAEQVAGVWYLQRFVGAESGWSDYRVLVIDGEAVAAMRRHGTSWITNIRQGGMPEPVSPDGELGDLALAAVRAVGATYAGVDLIRDSAGRLQLLEVNSMPAWRGLQSVTPIALAGRLAGAIAARVGTSLVAA